MSADKTRYRCDGVRRRVSGSCHVSLGLVRGRAGEERCIRNAPCLNSRKFPRIRLAYIILPRRATGCRSSAFVRNTCESLSLAYLGFPPAIRFARAQKKEKKRRKKGKKIFRALRSPLCASKAMNGFVRWLCRARTRNVKDMRYKYVRGRNFGKFIASLHRRLRVKEAFSLSAFQFSRRENLARRYSASLQKINETCITI